MDKETRYYDDGWSSGLLIGFISGVIFQMFSDFINALLNK